MHKSLHIVASCAELKSRVVPAERRLSTYAEGTSTERLRRWWDALTSADDVERVAATQLYKGPYWTAVLDLSRIASEVGWRVDLWVASAGYGLVPASVPIASYAATFSPGHGDSVPEAGFLNRHAANQDWWDLLSGTQLAGASVRHLSNLAISGQNVAVIVLGSPWYIGAMATDLRVLGGSVAAGNLAIVTSRLPRAAMDLEPSWIPSTDRLHRIVGGGMSSLHPRVAKHVLQLVTPAEFTAGTARAALAVASEAVLSRPRSSRSKSTPNDVLRFIQLRLKDTPRASATSLLREFRELGRAFEQKRFYDVYQQAKRN